MKYNFDEIIDRRGTCACKVDNMPGGGTIEDTLPVWIADMDFKCPQPVIDAIRERADHGIFGYTTFNNEEVKKATVGWFTRRFGWSFDIKDIRFSPGVVPGIAFLINILTRPGDGIIIQSPVYYPFTNKIMTNGRLVVNNPLIKEKVDDKEYNMITYKMDYEDLEEKLANPINKGIILSNPHNPVGRVWTEEELFKVLELCKKYNKWIISDEIHCDLTRKGQKHIPFLKMVDERMPEYRDKVIVCTAPSKTFNIAGLQSSNIIIPSDDYKVLWNRAVCDQLSMGYNVNPLSLAAVTAAYKEGDEWLDQLKEYLDGNIQYIKDFLKENLPEAEMADCQGTYLVWIDLSAYCKDPKKLEQAMLKVGKLATDEGYIFGHEGDSFERLNVAMPRKLIEDCMNRLAKGALWAREN